MVLNRSVFLSDNPISLHFVKMHQNVHLSYVIFVRKYKNVMIMLQKEQENPLKISFCFEAEDIIIIYYINPQALRFYPTSEPLYSLQLHLRLYKSALWWRLYPLQNSCTAFSFTLGYIKVLCGGVCTLFKTPVQPLASPQAI